MKANTRQTKKSRISEPCMCGERWCVECADAYLRNSDMTMTWLTVLFTDAPKTIDPAWLAKFVLVRLKQDVDVAQALKVWATKQERMFQTHGKKRKSSRSRKTT